MTLKWFRKDASSDELRELLATTEAALTAAQAAVVAARDSLDLDGSDNAVRGLLKAQEAEQIAQARVDSARRNLEAATQREAAEQRAQLQARADELRAQLSRESIQARIAPLLQRQVDLLEQTAACRCELREISDGLSATKRELHGVLLELGGVDHEIKTELGRIEGQIATVTNPVLLSELLKARIPELPAGHLRDRLSELGPQVSTYVRLADRW